MKKAVVAMALIAGLALPLSAKAREWADAGGWSIIEGEDYCALASDFKGDGETNLVLSLKVDGEVLFGISNDNWSTQDDRLYTDLKYTLRSGTYSGGSAVGLHINGKGGFVTKLAPQFVDEFAASPAIAISKGNTLVDHLNLDGSGAAVAQARRCLAHLTATKAAEAREKARLAHIPLDPFAGDRPSSPASSPVEWLRKPSDEDITRYFPDRAARMGIDGSATIRCNITDRGLLEACTVVAETPNDQGFGDSAIKMSKLFKARPTVPAPTSTVDVPIVFRLPRG